MNVTLIQNGRLVIELCGSSAIEQAFIEEMSDGRVVKVERHSFEGESTLVISSEK